MLKLVLGTLSGAAIALTGSGALAADGASENLTLLCQGTDVAMIPYAGYAYGPPTRDMRIPSQIVVVLEDGAMRIKPPAAWAPVYAKKPSDGWYPLEKTSVDKFSIRGRLNFSRLDRYRLTIDRRTGAATFGAFSGICNSIASQRDATRF